MKALLVLPFLISNILFASNLPLLTELDDIKINKYPKFLNSKLVKILMKHQGMAKILNA